MKNQFLSIRILFSALLLISLLSPLPGSMGLALAANTTQPSKAMPTTLADTMKAMMNNLKIVFSQVNDPQANASSAALTDEFVALTLHSKEFTPDTITSLPIERQAAAKVQYDKLLDQSAELGKQMAAAFRVHDNAAALALLKQLNQARADGHTQFKVN